MISEIKSPVQEKIYLELYEQLYRHAYRQLDIYSLGHLWDHFHEQFWRGDQPRASNQVGTQLGIDIKERYAV